MKLKELKTILIQKNPYNIFTNEENFHPESNTFLKFPDMSKYKISNSKKISIHTLTEYKAKTSKVSPIAKSLKKVALSSNLYGNYINFYTNFTQEKYFKNPSVDRYPLLKNKNYLSIKLQNLTIQIPNGTKKKENLSSSDSNSIFLSYLKTIKKPRNYGQKLKNELNYYKDKYFNDKNEEDDSKNDWKNFSELCYENLFESKFLKKIQIKKIDINNCFIEKQNNILFFRDYIKKVAELNDIFNEKNYHRNVSFGGRTVIKKENMEFTLDIYSLCFKFFALYDNDNNKNNKKKESQKLYFPFILMPFFYLLDFTSFKVLLSEIIIYNKNKGFEYVKGKLLIQTLKKYAIYIQNSLKHINNYINNITYNKNEAIFPLIYDWIVTTDFLNEEQKENNDNNSENNDNYKCFKLKIVLPKIKFNVDNLKIKINKLLNKQIIAYLLQNKFKNWKKFIFFDLFSTKKFKIIMNIIMSNMYYKINLKKINLSHKYKRLNKDYEFFLTIFGEKNSLYYALIPYVIFVLFRQNKEKFQKINLNLKESINLIKYKNSWGIINTLFKCMSFDKMKNNISFKFDLLEGEQIEKADDNIGENIKINNIDNINNYNTNIGYMSSTSQRNFNIHKVSSKIKNIREKEANNVVIKYTDKNFIITLLNYTLRKINITPIGSEEKYLIVPPKLLDDITSIKDYNNIFNLNCTDIPIIAKYIAENSNDILFTKESNNKAEEKKMIDDIDNGEYFKDVLQKEEEVKKSDTPRDNFNLPRSNSLKSLPNSDENRITTKNEDQDGIDNIRNYKKRMSTKYVFPNKIFLARGSKKKVTITNINELNKNRFENLQNDILKRRTFVGGEINF